MNKATIPLLIVAVLLLSGIGIFFGLSKSKNQTNSDINQDNTLTQEDAVANLLGEDLASEPSSPTENQPTEIIPETTNTEDNAAPDFTLPKLGGGEITLADYKGEKHVILDFWASWCHNCQRDMPKLSEFYTQHKDDIEIIGVNLQEDSATAQEFVDKYRVNFPIALDSSGKAATDYLILYTNTHVLINKEGKIIGVVPGDLNESHIEKLLES